jgi:hypothetical protein
MSSLPEFTLECVTAAMLAAYSSVIQVLNVRYAVGISRWQWQSGSTEGSPGPQSLLVRWRGVPKSAYQSWSWLPAVLLGCSHQYLGAAMTFCACRVAGFGVCADVAFFLLLRNEHHQGVLRNTVSPWSHFPLEMYHLARYEPLTVFRFLATSRPTRGWAFNHVTIENGYSRLGVTANKSKAFQAFIHHAHPCRHCGKSFAACSAPCCPQEVVRRFEHIQTALVVEHAWQCNVALDLLEMHEDAEASDSDLAVALGIIMPLKVFFCSLAEIGSLWVCGYKQFAAQLLM